MNFEHARFNMIEQQIRPWGVVDAGVLQLLDSIKREDFSPHHLRNLALSDTELPLGQGQYMLSPKVQARLVADARIQASDDVLQIGAGTGYMTALMAKLAQSVLGYELQPELAKAAQKNLSAIDIQNAKVLAQDASRMSLDKKFDVIVFCGSLAAIPDAYINMLKPQGRLLAIVGEEPMMRATIITRLADGTLSTTQPWDTVAPRLENFAQELSFSF